MPHVCEPCLVMFVFSVDTIIGMSLVSLDPEADIQILFLQLGLLLRPGIEHKVLNTNIVCQLLFLYYLYNIIVFIKYIECRFFLFFFFV